MIEPAALQTESCSFFRAEGEESMIRVGILGATGYTGYELIKIIRKHPKAELVFASSETYAGRKYTEVYPCPYEDIVLIAPDKVPLREVDLVFLCTPHGASAPLAQRVLAAGTRCVDLSADFRLRDAEVYARWYREHPVPSLLSDAVYGLTEVYRSEIKRARLVANPGCYPTGPLLALYPLLRHGYVRGDKLIIDAKSGVSGAGAKPSLKTHFCNVHDNFSAYSVGHSHRHVPEIEQELARFADRPMCVTFVPHLLPVSRGILSTMYISLDPSIRGEDVVALWRQVYGGAPFIQVLDVGRLATLAHVVNTNRCALSIASAGVPGEWIIITALDNLLKGASGQAAQNMNIMFDLDETLGLL